VARPRVVSAKALGGSLRLLYVTDLHGDVAKYERAFNVAVRQGVAAVVNGGDLLPRRGGAAGQETFLREFIEGHLGEYDGTGIEYVACLGNDDIRLLDEVFDEVCSRHESATNLAQRKYELGGVELVGMNWVVDYPFRLKDRCRMDNDDYVFQAQFGSGLLSSPDEFIELEDWFAYARTLPTIEEELRALVRPSDMTSAIYVMHMPPSGLGLDSCGSGECVGSASVREFIEREQPRMTLHGHIHESPDVSSSWRAVVGDTTCVQPGQSPDGGPLTYVLIDTGDWSCERRLETE